MHFLSIILVLLLGGTILVLTARIPFSSGEKGWRRWLMIVASFLLVVGIAGFFGAALSATGGLDGLPASFEWPLGYASGVVTTPDGRYLAPHDASARIQVYDADWKYLHGWRVDAGGGVFKLVNPTADQVEVVTARGQRHYVYGLDGRLISQSTYEPPADYNSFPEIGKSLVVPTPPHLWVFTHPGISWGVAFVGMILLAVIGNAGRQWIFGCRTDSRAAEHGR